MTLVPKQWICWARDYFWPHRNGTEAGILNLALSLIVILLHGGKKIECEHEHVVWAVSVTRNIAWHITWSAVRILYSDRSDNFIDSLSNSLTNKTKEIANEWRQI